MYNPKSLMAEEFICDEEIIETLEYADANKENMELIDRILDKAAQKRGLTHREASVLLACEDASCVAKMYSLSEQIKKDFYGKRATPGCLSPGTVYSAYRKMQGWGWSSHGGSAG